MALFSQKLFSGEASLPLQASLYKLVFTKFCGTTRFVHFRAFLQSLHEENLLEMFFENTFMRKLCRPLITCLESGMLIPLF